MAPPRPAPLHQATPPDRGCGVHGTLGQLLIALSMLQRLPAGLRGCSTDGYQLSFVLEQWATRLLGLCHLSGDQALGWSPGPSGHGQPSSPAPQGWLTQEMCTQGAVDPP